MPIACCELIPDTAHKLLAALADAAHALWLGWGFTLFYRLYDRLFSRLSGGNDG